MELQARILNDGLLVSWRVDQQRQDATGNEFSTAISILAYALTAEDRHSIPTEIVRAARTLLAQIEGAPPLNVGVRKFYLAAVTIALDAEKISRRVKRLARSDRSRGPGRDQDGFYFWDYSFLDTAGLSPRRDYFHVPADALEILVASGSVAGRFQRLAALRIAADDAKRIVDDKLYFAGHELAASKVQAWMALALLRARNLADADTLSNQLVARFLGGIPENVIGSLIFPGLVLLVSAIASTLPDELLRLLQWANVVATPASAPGQTPAFPGWWEMARVFLRAAGVISLIAWGQPLVTRMRTYIRNCFP